MAGVVMKFEARLPESEERLLFEFRTERRLRVSGFGLFSVCFA